MAYANELRAMLRPFVFRRYIDFSVIQSLRNMKGMIAREVRRRGLKDNIKLGAGGIREIEFIVQVFQLIRGGREPSLQSRSLLPTLAPLSSCTCCRKAMRKPCARPIFSCAVWKTCCKASTTSRRRPCRAMNLTARVWPGGCVWTTGRR
jgi:hypothetical protein